jgi:hypothetical protein
VYEKEEVIGSSFLVGGVHKLRKSKIKFEILAFIDFT